jgi:hypothetical protein
MNMLSHPFKEMHSKKRLRAAWAQANTCLITVCIKTIA